MVNYVNSVNKIQALEFDPPFLFFLQIILHTKMETARNDVNNNPTTMNTTSLQVPPNALDFEYVRTIDKKTPNEFSAPWNFSDVVLVVEGTKFHVHRCILSISSPVFQAMFTSQFKESTAEEIPLPEKSADEVEQLLKLIYFDDSKQKVTGK